MKGITPIIAIVLLLAITISIVAFSFTYFQRITSGQFRKLENQTGSLSFGKAIAIESIDTKGGNVKVYVRNVGSESIKEGELIVYVNGTAYDCDLFKIDNTDTESLSVNEVGYCNTTATSCTNKVKVSSPGNYDEMEC